MFPGLERGDGHVQPVRRGDRYKINFSICDKLAPVPRRAGKPELRRHGIGALLWNVTQHFEARTDNIAKVRLDVLVCKGVALAHIAGSDQPEADFIHAFEHLKLGPRSSFQLKLSVSVMNPFA